MPIYEESFRIGSGRYIQGKGYISKCGDEVKRVGTSAILIGDDTSLNLTREKIADSMTAAGLKYEFIVHNGTCNDEAATKIASYAKEKGYDVIVGVGGGVIMDFAKVCAHFADMPVINIPTSSATCAAYTPLSVRYTPEGKTVGTMHFENEVNAVIADTEIMAAQPVRLLLAGVFDSLAKFLEIKHRYNEKDESYPLGLDYAYVLSKRSYDFIVSKIQKCLDDIKKGEITEDFETLIFTLIAVTGVISGIARGSNQTALGHKFYETTRFFFPEESKPYLHGEIVGVGLLLQNHFNGEEENNTFLINLMQKYNMPFKITDVGVTDSMETFEKYYEKICHSSSINHENKEKCEKFKQSLLYFWNLNKE